MSDPTVQEVATKIDDIWEAIARLEARLNELSERELPPKIRTEHPHIVRVQGVCGGRPVIEARLERRGFFPAGGGRLKVSVEPVSRLRPLHLTERGALVRATVRILSARLPDHVAEREKQTIMRATGWPETASLKTIPSNMRIRVSSSSRPPMAW